MANTYSTVQGDMWDHIAKKVYGDEYKLHFLMEANPKHIETVIFAAGVTLLVPSLSEENQALLPPWRRSS